MEFAGISSVRPDASHERGAQSGENLLVEPRHGEPVRAHAVRDFTGAPIWNEGGARRRARIGVRWIRHRLVRPERGGC